MPADLFVSYARTDRDRVLPWVQQLQEAGISLWLDEADIDAAHLWTGEITDAIDACRVLLLILSPAAVASRQVAREVALASEANKPILPLLLEPTPLTGPLRYHLADVQHIELFGPDPEQKLPSILRALARLGVAPPGQETAPPSAPPRSPEPGAGSARPAAHNLPQALTRFIGREREIAAVREQLAGARLLTLTGAGGTGKTRLALQVAGELPDAYPDGVWLVELAALADPALVSQEVARALEVREEPGRPLIETLLGALRPKQLLLVLDNCEHLIDACAALTHALLRACPGVRLLATSRQALGVPGESLFRVPSLAAPAPPPPPVEQLTQYEAVRLFIDRAQLSQPSFAVTNANAPAVAEVCYRLDGIPLAIELAAARVKLLSPEQILTRLADRFRLLTGGSRTVLPRQQTLRAALDWSYDLLTQGERVLLRRLSVFAGGLSLEAAEAVCGGEEMDAYEVLDRLGQLVEKSLVQVDEPGSESRYQLLETIRQYGAEKLQGSGEAAALHGRHRDWYLALAEQAEPELQGPAQGEWLERLEREHDNLRAALAWFAESGELAVGLRLGGVLAGFWELRGYWAEGRERLERLLALPGASAPTAARAKGLHAAGMLAARRGDYGAAREFFQESLAIRRELGSKRDIAHSLNNLGLTAWYQADYGTAWAFFEESVAIQRELDDPWGLALALNNLGLVAYDQGDSGASRSLHAESLAIRRKLGDRSGIAQSLHNLGNVAGGQRDYTAARGLYTEALAIQRELDDKRSIALSLYNLGLVACYQEEYAAAQALSEESLAIQRELGDPWGVALSLQSLGNVARYQGDYGSARALLQESLARFRELGYKRGIAGSLNNLGKVGLHQGDYGAAHLLLRESLAMQRELGDQQGIAACLEGLATVACAEGQPERAARLSGAAEALGGTIGTPLPPSERAHYERHVAAVRAALGEAAFTAAWAEGRAMGMEEAIASALEAGGEEASAGTQ